MQELTIKDIRNLPIHVLSCIQSMRGRNQSGRRIILDLVPIASALVLLVLLSTYAVFMFNDELDLKYFPILLIISIVLIVCIKLFSRQCIIACGEYSATEFSSSKMYAFEKGINELLSVLPNKDTKLIFYPRIQEFVQIDQDILCAMIEQHLSAVAQMKHVVYVAKYTSKIDKSIVYHIVDPDLIGPLAVDFDEELNSFVLLRLNDD